MLQAATSAMEDNKHARLRQAGLEATLEVMRYFPMDKESALGQAGRQLFIALFGAGTQDDSRPREETTQPWMGSAAQRGRRDRLAFLMGVGMKDPHPDVRAVGAALSTSHKKQLILGRI